MNRKGVELQNFI